MVLIDDSPILVEVLARWRREQAITTIKVYPNLQRPIASLEQSYLPTIYAHCTILKKTYEIISSIMFTFNAIRRCSKNIDKHT